MSTILTEKGCLLCNFYGLCAVSVFFNPDLGVEKITLAGPCPKEILMKSAKFQKEDERREKQSNKQPSSSSQKSLVSHPQ